MRGKGKKVSLSLSSPSCRVRVSSVQLLEVRVKRVQSGKEKDVQESGGMPARAPGQRRGEGEWTGWGSGFGKHQRSPWLPFPIRHHLSSHINTQAVSLKKSF